MADDTTGERALLDFEVAGTSPRGMQVQLRRECARYICGGDSNDGIALIVNSVRGAGNSVAISSLIAALLCTRAGSEVVFFAPTQAAARRMRGRVVHDITCAGYTSHINKRNADSIWLQFNEGGGGSSIRKAEFYSGNRHSIRGLGANIVIVDGADMVSADVYYEVIIPLLEVVHARAILVRISDADVRALDSRALRLTPPRSLIVSSYCTACGENADCEHQHDAYSNASEGFWPQDIADEAAQRPEWAAANNLQHVRYIYEQEHGETILLTGAESGEI